MSFVFILNVPNQVFLIFDESPSVIKVLKQDTSSIWYPIRYPVRFNCTVPVPSRRVGMQKIFDRIIWLFLYSVSGRNTNLTSQIHIRPDQIVEGRISGRISNHKRTYIRPDI